MLISVDLEAAEKKAIESVFPGCEIVYCNFHVMKNWRKKAYSKDYNSKRNVFYDSQWKKVETPFRSLKKNY